MTAEPRPTLDFIVFHDRFRDALAKSKPEYLNPVGEDEFSIKLQEVSANPTNASLFQIVQAARNVSAPILVVAELSKLMTVSSKESEYKWYYTVKKSSYTDSEGKKRSRLVSDTSHGVNVTKEGSGSQFKMYYQIIDTGTRNVLNGDSIDKIRDDIKSYSNWNQTRVSTSSLYKKASGSYKKLNSKERNALHSKATPKNPMELIRESAGQIGDEVATALLSVVETYRPAPPAQ